MKLRPLTEKELKQRRTLDERLKGRKPTRNCFESEYLDAKILKIINIVVVVAVIVWLVGLFFGGFGSLSAIRVGK